MVAPRVRRVLTASSTITGPKDIPPAPIRQILGPVAVVLRRLRAHRLLRLAVPPRRYAAGAVTSSIHAR